jgi:EAL domain-containing protein (putative c-di-GMP-specific phosphodiesterase class I)
VIDELRQAGVRVALDDFGTGYATLSQLLSFCFDKIKIDRSFVSHLGESDDSKVIVRAILGIAKGFGLTTTAEGVEDCGAVRVFESQWLHRGGRVICSARLSPPLISLRCSITGA